MPPQSHCSNGRDVALRHFSAAAAAAAAAAALAAAGRVAAGLFKFDIMDELDEFREGEVAGRIGEGKEVQSRVDHPCWTDFPAEPGTFPRACRSQGGLEDAQEDWRCFAVSTNISKAKGQWITGDTGDKQVRWLRCFDCNWGGKFGKFENFATFAGLGEQGGERRWGRSCWKTGRDTETAWRCQRSSDRCRDGVWLAAQATRGEVKEHFSWNKSGEGDEDELAEKLEETQRLIEDARDRATDAEMECDSLRKQLEEKSKSTSLRNKSGEGDEDDLAEKLEETQRLLEDARDRATDAEMECDSLPKQLEEEKSKGPSMQGQERFAIEVEYESDWCVALPKQLEEEKSKGPSMQGQERFAIEVEYESDWCVALPKQLEEEKSKGPSMQGQERFAIEVEYESDWCVACVKPGKEVCSLFDTNRCGFDRRLPRVRWTDASGSLQRQLPQLANAQGRELIGLDELPWELRRQIRSYLDVPGFFAERATAPGLQIRYFTVASGVFQRPDWGELRVKQLLAAEITRLEGKRNTVNLQRNVSDLREFPEIWELWR